MPALSDLTLCLTKLSLPFDNFLCTQCDQVGFPPLSLGGGLGRVLGGNFYWGISGILAGTGLWVWGWWAFFWRYLCSSFRLLGLATCLTFRLTCTLFTFLNIWPVLTVLSFFNWASMSYCSDSASAPANIAVAMNLGRCEG